MNNDQQHTTSHAKELFVFSPTGGIVMNVDPRSLPQHNSDALTKFELIGTNPLIKANKAGNFSDFDHYIDDPTNPEIKNAVLNNITFADGKVCLNKDAVDIIYCAFDIFKDNQRFDVMTSGHISFYVNMLLLYPPELKQNSLNQYFATLIKILKNDLVPLDSKYMLTFKALEVEWERCTFLKYSLFKNFFVTMKKFFKASPLYARVPFMDQATTSAHQDLLTRILNGRATAILKFLIDCDDALKLLMVFKVTEWMQKLEALKILQTVNINYLIAKGRDPNAVEFIKQMYGKAAVVIPPQDLKPEDHISDEQITKMTANVNIPKQAPAKVQVHNGPTQEIRATKKVSDIRKKSSDVEIDDFVTIPKVQPAKNKKKEEVIVEQVEIKKKEIQQFEVIKQSPQESGKKPKKVKQERIDLFFGLLDVHKYEDDFGGRIRNFLKKATKIGYEFESEDLPKIETIISKFKKHYTPEQKIEVIRNYEKFCLDFNIQVNPKFISNIEDNSKPPIALKEHKAPKNESLGSAPQSGAQIPQKTTVTIEKSTPVYPAGSGSKQKVNEAKLNENKSAKEVYDKMKNKAYEHDSNDQEQTIKVSKNEFKHQKEKEFVKQQQQEEKHQTEEHVIYCKNLSPMAEQMNTNKPLFERTARIQEDLERILNKKFPFLKVTKIGSIGCGYATALTNNFNMALIRKDLAVSVQEPQLMHDVFQFLTENYFTEESNSSIMSKFNKVTVAFNDRRDKQLRCTLVYDENNTYRDLTQKIKLILSIQPSILNVFYKLQKELQAKNLLSHDGCSSYLLMIMLLTSCQLEFGGRRFLQGLKENKMQFNQQKFSQHDLLKRFTTIFHNCIQNEISRNYYVSLLRGCLDQIAASKPEFSQDQCLIYLEDPFNPHVNCSKNLAVSKSENIIDFIEGLYAEYGN